MQFISAILQTQRAWVDFYSYYLSSTKKISWINTDGSTFAAQLMQR